MCGRGIDQVLAYPCSPELYENYLRSAEDYVALAEQANGRIPRRNGPSYIWGVALDEFARMRPNARIVNLETAVTRSNDHADKGINYRISAENAGCLAAAKIDCCALANNHVLDWGQAGLLDTLATLERLNIKAAGAGKSAGEARAPAVLSLAGTRLLVFSYGAASSGVPPEWGATEKRPGVNLINGLSIRDAAKIAEEIAAFTAESEQLLGPTFMTAASASTRTNTEPNVVRTATTTERAKVANFIPDLLNSWPGSKESSKEKTGNLTYKYRAIPAQYLFPDVMTRNRHQFPHLSIRLHAGSSHSAHG